MTIDKHSQHIPAVMDCIAKRYPPRSSEEAHRVYGTQLTTPFHTVRYLLRGSIPSTDTTRWYQMNQFVSSGVTPVGTLAGFSDTYGHWEERARASGDEYVEGELDSLLPYSSTTLADALRHASDLAARIRGHQTLRDGNHRTSLLAFVVSLAESHVLLRPDFPLYRAYIVLSARQHPGNRDNLLLDDAIHDTANALFHFARRHVKPGVADWSYMDHWSQQIRCLPVYAAHVEATYSHLLEMADEESKLEGSRKQLRRWKELSEEERRHVKLAHPEFHPGVHKTKAKGRM